MKVLNIHGYHGAPMNSACLALKKPGCEIISPALDYDADAPEKILGRFQYIVKECQPNAIVGGSDEVIDTHDLTETICGNSRYRVIPEGRHSGAAMPLEEYFEEVLFKRMSLF